MKQRMRGELLPPESASTSSSRARGVVLESFSLPPAQQVVSGEVGGVVRGADDHEAAVGGQVVDAVGNGDAVGLGAEVVVVDGKRGSFPSRAVVLEIAHQFPLLGVDADDRQAAFGEPQALRGDVLELFVAVGTGAGATRL